MVHHYRVSQDIDTEDRREEFEPIAYPLFAMAIRLARNRIVTAQKRSSHASLGDVKHLNFGGIHRFPTCLPRHNPSPGQRRSNANDVCYTQKH